MARLSGAWRRRRERLVEFRLAAQAALTCEVEVPGDGEEVRFHCRRADLAWRRPQADERLRGDVIGERRVAGEIEREPVHVSCIALVDVVGIRDHRPLDEYTHEGTKGYANAYNRLPCPSPQVLVSALMRSSPPRRRRHGRGLSRPRHEAQSRRRAEGPARARSPRDPDRLARFQREAQVLAVAQSSEHRARSTASRTRGGRRTRW